MIKIDSSGKFWSTGVEDWSKVWGEEPYRTATTTTNWLTLPMTAEEIKKQVNDAMKQFEKQEEIESIAGFKIGDKVKMFDPVRYGTVIDFRYERKIDDEMYFIEIFWDDGMKKEYFLPTNEFVKIDKGEEKMKVKDENKNKISVFKGKIYKVMFNGPATVLFVDSLYADKKEKFITKAYNEDFDEEKGLALALLKSFGMSYLDFKRILATAKKDEQNKKEKNIEDKNLQNENDVALDLTHLISTDSYVPNQSPKGKHKGKPYQFELDDVVVVRDCYSYKYENSEDVQPLLNKELAIYDMYEENYTKLFVVEYMDRKFLFAGSELEPIFQD